MRIKIRLKMVVDILLFLSGLICIGTGLALLILPSGPGTQAGIKASSSVFDLFTSVVRLTLLYIWRSSPIYVLWIHFTHIVCQAI